MSVLTLKVDSPAPHGLGAASRMCTGLYRIAYGLGCAHSRVRSEYGTRAWSAVTAVAARNRPPCALRTR